MVPQYLVTMAHKQKYSTMDMLFQKIGVRSCTRGILITKLDFRSPVGFCCTNKTCKKIFIRQLFSNTK